MTGRKRYLNTEYATMQILESSFEKKTDDVKQMNMHVHFAISAQ